MTQTACNNNTFLKRMRYKYHASAVYNIYASFITQILVDKVAFLSQNKHISYKILSFVCIRD